MPLAVHIPHVVEQVGSMAGFAAVIGLAVLSALYFSQARDLRRLREWAGRAPERAAEMGQGAGAPVPGRVVAQPQRPIPQPVHPVQPQQPAQPGQQQQPAAANGDAAPSVTPGSAAGAAVAAGAAAKAAEGEKADGAKDGEPAKQDEGAKQGEGEAAKPGEGDGKPAAPAAKPGMPAPASAAAAGAAGAAASAGAGAASVVGPAAPAQGAPTQGAGSSAPAQGAPAPAPAGAGAAAGAKPATPQRPPGSVLPPRTGTLPPVRRLPSSNVGAAQTGVLGQSPAQQQQRKKRNPLYVVLAVVGVLVLGAAAAVGVPALVNGKNDDAKKTSKTSSTTTAKAAPLTPGNITVAVLNGTGVAGLAGRIGDRVEADGFKKGTVSNASLSSGQRANSIVMYSRGHSREARLVARKLDISGPVRPVDSESQQIAGDASVVVLVGTDKSQ